MASAAGAGWEDPIEVGLPGNTLFEVWWLDPIAAFAVAVLAIREGQESWRGEGCCDHC